MTPPHCKYQTRKYQTRKYQTRKRQAAQRGFTLLEMMIAISLTALIFSGVMLLFDSSSRTTLRTQAQIYATNDASNAIQNVVGQMRQAQSFTLPTSAAANTAEAGWVTLAGTSLAQFSTSYDSGTGAETINTALQITVPPPLTPATNGYKSGISAIQVQNAAGSATDIPDQPFKADGGGSNSAVLIYRGDPDGTPDPDPTGSPVKDAGTYLWEYTIPTTHLFIPDVAHGNPVGLCKSVAAAPNAVQFVRPAYSGVAEKYQVEIKIISGYYSPIHGSETIEGSSGLSQLTGKCVYMRDHSTAGAPGNAATQSSNNAFQYHP